VPKDTHAETLADTPAVVRGGVVHQQDLPIFGQGRREGPEAGLQGASPVVDGHDDAEAGLGWGRSGEGDGGLRLEQDDSR
jgi:hypothetical protein